MLAEPAAASRRLRNQSDAAAPTAGPVSRGLVAACVDVPAYVDALEAPARPFGWLSGEERTARL